MAASHGRVLCRECHRRVHSLERKGLSLELATRQVLHVPEVSPRTIAVLRLLVSRNKPARQEPEKLPKNHKRCRRCRRVLHYDSFKVRISSPAKRVFGYMACIDCRTKESKYRPKKTPQRKSTQVTEK